MKTVSSESRPSDLISHSRGINRLPIPITTEMSPRWFSCCCQRSSPIEAYHRRILIRLEPKMRLVFIGFHSNYLNRLRTYLSRLGFHMVTGSLKVCTWGRSRCVALIGRSRWMRSCRLLKRCMMFSDYSFLSFNGFCKITKILKV